MSVIAINAGICFYILVTMYCIYVCTIQHHVNTDNDNVIMTHLQFHYDEFTLCYDCTIVMIELYMIKIWNIEV